MAPTDKLQTLFIGLAVLMVLTCITGLVLPHRYDPVPYILTWVGGILGIGFLCAGKWIGSGHD